MTISDLKKKVEKLEKMTVKLSEPFPWRGLEGAEVCFSLSYESTEKADNLRVLNKALKKPMCGFRYNKHTTVHFEANENSYSGGEYVKRFIYEHKNDETVKLFFE